MKTKQKLFYVTLKNYDSPISSLKFGNEVISFSKSGKNLGVIFYEKLNLNDHIASVSKTVLKFVDSNKYQILLLLNLAYRSLLHRSFFHV